MGTPLFERTTRKVRLTVAGEAFAAEARLTLFHAERAVKGARAANYSALGGRNKTGPPRHGMRPEFLLQVVGVKADIFSSAYKDALFKNQGLWGARAMFGLPINPASAI